MLLPALCLRRRLPFARALHQVRVFPQPIEIGIERRDWSNQASPEAQAWRLGLQYALAEPHGFIGRARRSRPRLADELRYILGGRGDMP